MKASQPTTTVTTPAAANHGPSLAPAPVQSGSYRSLEFMATTQRRRRAGSPRQHCHHCGSTNLTKTAWQDLLPRVSGIDAFLIYDGAKPIPRTLTFCGSCAEWLASSIEAQQVEELATPNRPALV